MRQVVLDEQLRSAQDEASDELGRVRILVAVDGSEGARGAARYAIWLAQRMPAALRFVGVVDPAVMFLPNDSPGTVDYLGLTKEFIAAEAARPAAEARRAGVVDARWRIYVGHPVTMLVRAIHDEGADLVVAGARRRGILGRLLGGGLAESLLSRSPAPVLVVRPDQESERGWRELDAIVAAILRGMALAGPAQDRSKLQ